MCIRDSRTVAAAQKIVERGLAEVVLVSPEDKIAEAAREAGADVSGCRIVDPDKSPLTDKFAQELYQLRKHKIDSPELSLIHI